MDKLYKPVIVRKEVDSTHFYFIDDENGKGQFFPSVTKILHETLPTPEALKNWLGDMGNEAAQLKLETAGLRGTALHDACERLVKKETLKLNEEFKDKNDKRAVVGFVNWFNDVKPIVKEAELTIASGKYKYAGTMDLLCEINGEPWIIDYKTSKGGNYVSFRLQLAAYHQAVLEMFGIDAKMGILHLNPRVRTRYTFYTDLNIEGKPVTTEDFLKVFEVYKMLNGGEIKQPDLTEVFPNEITLYEKEKK